MIDTLLQQGKRVTLLYAARSSADIAFINKLKQFETAGLNIRLFIDERGQRINEDILAIADKNDVVYICGPDSMSKAFSRILQKQGLYHKNIVIERFAF